LSKTFFSWEKQWVFSAACQYAFDIISLKFIFRKGRETELKALYLRKGSIARFVIVMLVVSSFFSFALQERASASALPPDPGFTGPASWTKFSNPGDFAMPFGLYMDDEDNLYVADVTGVNGVSGGSIKKISTTTKEVTPLSQPEDFEFPITVTKDVYGKLYAVNGQFSGNTSTRTVKVLNPSGWEVLGNASSLGLVNPFGIISDSFGNIYVSDYVSTNGPLTSGKIFKYTASTQTWSLLTDSIVAPLDMAIDSQNRLFVATYTKVFRSDSNQTNWTDITYGAPFTIPYGITLSHDGTPYVSAMSLNPQNPGMIGGVYKLSGETWTLINDGTGGSFGLGDLAFDSQGYLYGTSLTNFGNGGFVYKYLNTITYDGNNATSGSVPVDEGAYKPGVTTSVYGNINNLERPGFTFGGWNTAANGSGTTYQSGDTTTPLTQSVTLYAIWNALSTITYDGNNATSGTVPVDDGTYRPGVITSVYGNINNLERPGFTFGGWNTAANGSGTTYQSGDTIALTQSVTLYAIWNALPTITSVTNDVYSYNLNIAQTHQTVVTATYSDATTVPLTSGVEFTSSNTAVAEVNATGLVTAKSAGQAVITSSYQGLQAVSNVTVNANPVFIPPAPGVEIFIDGVKQDMAKSKQEIVNGQTVTTVIVDTDKVTAKLEKENNKLVTIPVTGGQVVIGQLTGNLVKTMESKDVQVQIVTDQATYTLPASLIQIDSISAQLGTNVALKDITINIQIASSTSSTADKVQSAADKSNVSVVVKPVEFEITATYNGKTVPISSFSSYVERMIAIPAGVDPAKVTTGVVLRPDGTLYHVPTVVKQQNGKYYAFVNSLTNSTYSVIFNQREFSDVNSHWAKADVNDLASRMVVQGVTDTEFRPDASITRAEFAAIVLNGLGIQPAAATGKFSDVNATKDWYAGIVQASVDYNLMSGYEDGTFHPTQAITRQEAITVLARALSIAKLNATLSDAEASQILSAYADGGQVAGWAKTSVASAISKNLVNGRGDKLEPSSSLTRAETAALVHRLLQTAGLINK
jgi:uncharacterized repeat protein (TIGR02543 family)